MGQYVCLVTVCYFPQLTKRKWESFVPFRKLDFKDHHELLDLHWHTVLSIPGFVDLENVPDELWSQLDVFQTQNYQFVR